MRKKLATKICAIAMTAAMVASLAGCGNDPGSSVDDLGGATIRVNGGIWSNLSADKEGSTDYIEAWDRAEKLQDKWNIKLEYVNLPNDDGYSTSDAILATITSGECFADIFTVGDDVMVNLKDYLAEVTNPDALEYGSIYIEPARWGGHTYGFTYDNMGSCYVLVYSRKYLENIGMEVTPTQKFLDGQWSYKECKDYLAEMKTKLPEGSYPIAVHSNHWISMAPAANGVVSVDSNGGIHLTDDGYVEALNFYCELLDAGLASPIVGYYKDEDGTPNATEDAVMPYGMDTMCTATEAKDHVLTMVEAWQFPYLEDTLSGEWGIVPWPWGSGVTCDGDYTHLSENYHTAQSIWTNIAVPQKEYRAADAQAIDDMDLFLISRDWCDMCSETGSKVRHEMWEAEKKNETYVNKGYDEGTLGAFSTWEDAGLYDWLHSRVLVDWGHSMNSNGVVRVNWNGYLVIGAREDARSSGASWQSSGDAAMKDKGYK